MVRARSDWMCMRKDLKTDDVLSSQFTIWVSPWATKMQFYYNLRKTNNTIPASTYEDLVQHREKCIAAIFEYCGLDPELCHKGVRALDYQSQRGLPWADGDASLLTPYKGRVKVIADRICDQCSVPRIGEEISLPGQLELYNLDNLRH